MVAALQQLGNQNLNFNTDLKDFGGKPTLDTAEQSLGSIVSLSLINGYPIAAPPQDFGEESTQVESWEPDYQNEAESEGEDIIEEPKDHGIEESHATLTQEAKEEEKEEEEAEKDLSKLTSSQLNMEDQNPDFLPVAHTDKLMFPTTTDSDADAQATCINGGLLKEVESDRLKDSQNEDVDGSLDKVTPDSGVEMHTESDTNDSEMHNEELPNSFNDNNHADQTRTISTAANEDATTADRQISVETEDKSPPICSICARRISANDQEHTADANTDCTENSDWETNNIPDEHKREGFEEKSAIPSNDGSIEQILPFSLNQLQSMLTTLTASESFKLLVQTITQSEPFSAVINQLKETQTTVNQEPINSADDHKMLINNFMEDLRTGLQTPLEPTSTPQLDSPRNLSLMPASELNEIINSPCLQSSTQEVEFKLKPHSSLVQMTNLDNL